MGNDIKIILKPEHIGYEEIEQLLRSVEYPAMIQTPVSGETGCAVALFNEKLVGTLSYKVYKLIHKTSWTKDKIIYKGFQFAVHKSYRKYGIAKKLLQHGEEFAYANKVDAIYGDTAQSERLLIKMYQRMGYVIVGFVSYRNTSYYSLVFRKPIHGKKFNKFYSLLRFYLQKFLCIVQYKEDGTMRKWRRMASMAKGVLKRKMKLNDIKNNRR